MPPYVSRKRDRSLSPAPTPPKKKQKQAVSKPAAKRAKPTLFDTVDAPVKNRKTVEENRKLLEKLDGDEDEDDSLSEADSDEFEDVPPGKRQKTRHGQSNEDEDEEDSGEEEMDWEDAIKDDSSAKATPSATRPEPEIGDISITMKEDGSYIEPLVSAATGKKGPSKRERRARVHAHCLHVQTLMWHNTVRNSWLNDKEVQKTLVDGLADGVKREVTRWKEAMGMLSKEELDAKKRAAAAKNKGKGKQGRKSRGDKIARDWSYNAEHAEQGVVDLSRGDPLLRLLRILTMYWKKRFAVTAPGLRKQGHKPLRRLRDDIRDWEKNRKSIEDYGERIESLKEFRMVAQECEGSRDVGAQLFVALLRGLGLETRMVANLQPIGFGWSRVEEADPKKAKKDAGKPTESDSEAEKETKSKKKMPAPALRNALTPNQSKKATPKEIPPRKSARGNKTQPINLDDSDSPLSSAPSEAEEAQGENSDEDDDLSVVDITPATQKKKPSRKYDRDLSFPSYWTEVKSPVSNKFIPVDPIVLSTIASTEELLQSFEPRGKGAEKAKQVMCYTVAFSSDGSAKDVTVRYLKKHQLPGKTKGARMPVEKVPIYDKKGKVKKYEEYDWFRTVMSVYDRPESKRTAADDLEDQTDLKPFKAAEKAKEVEKESLQWYKQSAEFALEQHLRREEAIVPGAKPVKSFTAGKGDKAKEHPVYRREDIVVCRTVESWHKEGRAIKMGEQAIKYVPMRAVTLIKKREMEDAQRETGEKLKQGLYSESQTDWIIPPPIENGVILKNAYGNMDVYVPTMVPKGAIHIPLKGTARICKRLQIDFAEACTGFEFGKQRAVPVLTGVVIAKENAAMLKDAWRADQAEIRRKEDTKRTSVALRWWRKMLMGLRIVERMRAEYAEAGGKEEEINPFVSRAHREGKRDSMPQPDGTFDEDDMAGGFFRPGHDEEEVPRRIPAPQHEAEGGGFLIEEDGDDPAGGFLVEDDVEDTELSKPSTSKPVSLQAMHQMDGATDDVDSAIEEEAPLLTPKTTSKRAVKPAASKLANRRASRKTVYESEEESISDLSDVPSEISDVDSDSDGTPAVRAKKASSPAVVIKKQTRDSKRLSTRTKPSHKTTPVKSPYFSSQREDSMDDEEEGPDEDFDEDFDDDEVVKPRRTTTRTRSKA